MCRYRGNIHIPFQVAGLLCALQISYKIYRYVYHESFHSLQFLSIICFHVTLGLPGSIKLYVKGSLDCTIGAFHVRTSRAISPPEWGTDPQCKLAQVTNWIWWWQCLATWHCISVWSLPCQFAADIGGLALSMAKSYWHGALPSTYNTCTHGHMSWKRGGRKREPVATPWTSSRWLSHVLWL